MARKGEKKMDGFGKSSKLDNIFTKVLRKKEYGKREPKKKRTVDVKEEKGSEQRRSARLSGGKPEDGSLLIGGKVARSKKRRDKLEVIVDQGLKRRKKERKRKEEEAAPVQVFRIHVSAAGEEQLREHLRGDGDTVMQVLQEEALPDVFSSELVNGLDLEGTSRDYVDEGHRCSVRCPVGCQGHLRQNEVVIFSGWRQGARLVSRSRVKARLLVVKPGDLEEEQSSQPVVKLRMNKFKRIGRKKKQADEVRRIQQERRRVEEAVEEAPLGEPIISPAPKVLGPPLPQKVAALLTSPPVSKMEAEAHAWNPDDRSANVELKVDDLFTMRRRPVAQSTDCVRGKTGYSSGSHLFRITWPTRQRGTHAMVGVSTLMAEVQADGYKGLLGDTANSWGWDLGRKQALHAGQHSAGGSLFPLSLNHHHQWTIPDEFNMILDMDAGTLAWFADNQYLGVSHRGIQGEVFPMVSTVWGHCEVSLLYLGSSSSSQVLPLKTLAKVEVLKALSNLAPSSSKQATEQFLVKLDHHPDLELPITLKHFLAGTS